MKPFIESEIERLEKAVNALKLVKRKLEVLRNYSKKHPLSEYRLMEQVEKDYKLYEDAKAEILASWETEEAPIISGPKQPSYATGGITSGRPFPANTVVISEKYYDK